MDSRSLLSGIAIGAALALAFDRDRGTLRRAIVRHRMLRGTRRAGATLEATFRDMRTRARGIAAAARGRFESDDVDDSRLVERVRTRLGRVCSHPRAIDVYARDGEVTLIGPALAHEVRGLLTAAASVRGVHSVVNGLEPHETADGTAFQDGQGQAARPQFGLRPPNWAPATRALVGAAALAAGGLAVAYSRR